MVYVYIYIYMMIVLLYVIQVAAMVDAEDRRPDLGYQAALNYAMAKKLVETDTKQTSPKEKDKPTRDKKTALSKAKSK